MRYRADQLAVLQDRTAAHALHDAAGFLRKLRIGYAEHHAAPVFVVRRIELDNLDRITLHAVAVHVGQDFRVTDFDFVCRRDRHTLQLAVQRIVRYGAENAAFCVLRHGSERFFGRKFALQRTRFTRLAALHAAHRRVNDCALLQRQQHAGLAVADAVTERAERAGLRVNVGQRADSCQAVAREHADAVRTGFVPARRHHDAFLRVSALERQLDRLSRRECDLLLQIVVRVQRGLTGAAQHIALLHARLLRRGVRAVRALHLGQLHDQHALRLHFDADRVPDRDDLGDFCRLRGDCHRKQQEQGERRAFCVIFLHFFTSAITMPRGA